MSSEHEMKEGSKKDDIKKLLAAPNRKRSVERKEVMGVMEEVSTVFTRTDTTATTIV